MTNSISRAIFSPIGMLLLALAIFLVADPAMAQSASADFSGGALKEAFCAFQGSFLLKTIVAIALIIVVIGYMLDVVRDGMAALLLKWAIGILAIFNVPMLMSWFGVSFGC